MAKKGREIKVYFTFVTDKFASARPLNLLINYSKPSTLGSTLTLHFGCVYDSRKSCYQMTFLKSFKIPNLDLQTHQGKCSLD